MKYHNKSLEVLVLNSETKEFFRETPYGYMQKIAPIYKEPDFSNGRAISWLPKKTCLVLQWAPLFLTWE
jgi:hypothetical protein